MIYQRKLYSEIKKYFNSPQAIVVTGVRRSGKTFLLRHIYQNIKSHNKLLLDLENPLTRRLFEERNYEKIKTNLEREGVKFSEKPYIFLDEIQWLRQIPSIVKYLIDHYQVKFFLTGSASFYLKNLFSESLSGRKFIFELFPLSFSEFLTFKSSRFVLPKMDEQVSDYFFRLVEPLWEEYLEFGGFPEVVLAEGRKEKERLLEEVFTSYFQKEIEQLSDFKKINLVRNFIILLAENNGNLLNLQRFSNELSVSRLTLEEWLEFLRATYLIDLLSPYSKKERIAIRKAKKVYFVDWGLASKISTQTSGQKFENCLFHNLKLWGKPSYYRKKSGVEIDFIIKTKKGEQIAFEAKETAHPFDLKRLKRLAEKLGLKKYFLVAKNYSKDKKVIYPWQISNPYMLSRYRNKPGYLS